MTPSSSAAPTPTGDPYEALPTEAIRADLADLDLRSTIDLVRLLAAEEATVPLAVAALAEPIAAAVDAIAARMTDGGRLIYVGAGTGGRLAALDAVECGPTFGMAQRIRVVLAGGAATLRWPQEEAEDDADAGRDDLLALEPGPADCVVGLAASGRTPYVAGALTAAAAAGCLTVAVSSVPGAKISRFADHPLEIVTGPEVVAGSTRLKAGTAQKLVLNALSTLVMVRLGRTYGNLMVDVEATNAKLRARVRRMVGHAAGVDEETAERALTESGDDPKVAIVALVAHIGPDQARRRLDLTRGQVRTAITLDSAAH